MAFGAFDPTKRGTHLVNLFSGAGMRKARLVIFAEPLGKSQPPNDPSREGPASYNLRSAQPPLKVVPVVIATLYKGQRRNYFRVKSL